MNFLEHVQYYLDFFKLREGWIGLLWFVLIFGFLSKLFLIKPAVSIVVLSIAGFISSLLMIFIIFAIILNKILKHFSLKEIKQYTQINNNTVAVILGDDSVHGNLNTLIISTYLGIRFLIKYLNLKKEKFKIYVEPSKNEFKKIISDIKIKRVFLIGHGSKTIFCLNRTEDPLLYSDFQNRRMKKDEIHLYHCTHSRENSKSLIDYLVKSKNRINCFIANKTVPVINYIILFYELYTNEKRNIKQTKNLKRAKK